MIDKVAWILIQDQKVLSARSKGKDTFYLPGGKREKGESDEECLMREIREELSVEILSNSISLVGVFKDQAHGKAEGVEVKMTCYKADYKGDLAVSQEIEEMRWLGMKDMDIISPVDRQIFRYLYDKGELL
ncbi:MAG: NUDIX domain-containing protein [Bacteroidota bacterium]